MIVIDNPIHNAQNPIPISDSTHDLLSEWYWQPIFGSDPAAPGEIE
jgi:hypothetical protein